MVIDRLADILEHVGREHRAAVAAGVPGAAGGARAGHRLQQGAADLGRLGDLVANVVDSLVTLERLFAFLSAATDQSAERPGTAAVAVIAALGVTESHVSKLTIILSTGGENDASGRGTSAATF